MTSAASAGATCKVREPLAARRLWPVQLRPRYRASSKADRSDQPPWQAWPGASYGCGQSFGYVRKIGANQVFDHRSRTVIGDVIKALNGRTIAGALAIGLGSAEACLDIVHACKGNKFVSMATPSVSFDKAPRGHLRTLWLVLTVGRLVSSNVSIALKSRTRQIRTKLIFGTSLMDNEVGPLIYADFLPKALADSSYAAAPDPSVVGRGLGRIPAGLEAQRKSVSAKKVVVSL